MSESALKRKDHAERVLSQTRKLDSDFICTPLFQNNLPLVPSGPFFRTVELPHSFEDFAVYSVGSSLERSYLWQPHVPKDVGLRVDFVDRESIMTNQDVDRKKVVTMDPADKVFMTEKKSKDLFQDEKLSWLRDTIYSNNDLFSNTNKFRGNEDLERGHQVLTKKQIGENSNPFSESFIGLSFDAASVKTAEAVEKANKKEKGEGSSRGSVEWIVPVLPADDDMWGQILSSVQFEAGTLDLLDDDAEGDAIARQQRKRRRVHDTILTNIRVPDDDTVKKGELGQSFEASLTCMEEPPESSRNVEEYKWKRDLKMDIRSKSLTDNFVVVVDTAKGVAEFCPVRSKIDMHKPQKGNGAPHDVSVKRREPLESEIVESNRLVKEKS